jgi:hypothetical protein
LRESWGTDGDTARFLAVAKTFGERPIEKQMKKTNDIPAAPIHQTAPLAPLKVIEIKKKRWWQFWR